MVFWVYLTLYIVKVSQFINVFFVWINEHISSDAGTGRGPLAPPIFGRSVNPILQNGEGRLSPPIATGTPNMFFTFRHHWFHKKRLWTFWDCNWNIVLLWVLMLGFLGKNCIFFISNWIFFFFRPSWNSRKGQATCSLLFSRS